MSTLAEIEAAVEMLPTSDQKELFGYLVQKLRHPDGRPWDPFDDIIGSIAGTPGETTSQNDEALLYGRPEA